jgi:hypothetical protein
MKTARKISQALPWGGLILRLDVSQARRLKGFGYTCVLLVFVVAASATAYSQPVRDRQKAIMDFNPVAYWPLDETKNNQRVRDLTHHHQDGFYEGLNADTPGSLPDGRAPFFGIPGINLTHTSAAIQGNAARTIIAWIKTTNHEAQAIVATGSAADAQAFNLVMYSGCGTVGVMGYNNDFYPCGGSSGIDSADGAWHMVAVVHDGFGNLRIYADGILDNQTFMTYATTGQQNYIGRSNHDKDVNCGIDSCAFPFRGSIDDVAIFDYVLSDQQIAQLAKP